MSISADSDRRDIVVIGASAGGVEALRTLIYGLDTAPPAAYFVVLHLPADSKSQLPHVLSGLSGLKAVHAADGQEIEYGTIYVAPPDYHLFVSRGHVVLTRGPRENRSRPAIDPLFRSAAEVYGPRVIGVLLTGMLDDGTLGLLEIHRRGGVTIVENPETALYSDMPQNAVSRVPVNHIADLHDIAATVRAEIGKPADVRNASVGQSTVSGLKTSGSIRNGASPHHSENGEISSGMDMSTNTDRPIRSTVDEERQHVASDIKAQESAESRRRISVYSCPDCGGVLWELDDEAVTKFRCHVGHTFAGESLFRAQNDMVEAALWSALRALTERGILSRQLAAQMRERGSEVSAVHFERRAAEVERNLRVLRTLITGSAEEAPAVGP
jgi:two-component system chemotaxis response regulator CheB